MPAGLRSHVRYPELLLKVQAAVSTACTTWTIPRCSTTARISGPSRARSARAISASRPTQPMEPNFVLMTLPGETKPEFIEILPFTPANRNNLIGWIAARSDDPHYGAAIVYDFPKTKLVDGPLQIEARIDQNAQLSGQLSLWNQQGSHVLRGALIVIPIGRALLYAEPIYLQAERSPMPQLRLVVLALQDRLAYGPTFEERWPASSATPRPRSPDRCHRLPAPPPPPPAGPGKPRPRQRRSHRLNGLISEAARNLADYQRLTAEGNSAKRDRSSRRSNARWTSLTSVPADEKRTGKRLQSDCAFPLERIPMRHRSLSPAACDGRVRTDAAKSDSAAGRRRRAARRCEEDELGPRDQSPAAGHGKRPSQGG